MVTMQHKTAFSFPALHDVPRNCTVCVITVLHTDSVTTGIEGGCGGLGKLERPGGHVPVVVGTVMVNSRRLRVNLALLRDREMGLQIAQIGGQIVCSLFTVAIYGYFLPVWRVLCPSSRVARVLSICLYIKRSQL
ncbi:hypothetical protein MN608_01950 [Microdochium nivale]|nr:hypothetical protein MN608_01950 [Microdochium nivale]